MVLPYLSIRIALYYLKFGIKPYTSQDQKQLKPTIPLEHLNYKDTLSVATRIYKAQEIAKKNIERAQEKIVRSVNQHYRPINQEVNDKVYLLTKNLKSYRLSRKLIGQQDSLFTILEKKGNIYKLDLPAGLKIYPYFVPDIFIKAPQDPLPSQQNPNPSRDVIKGVKEQEVNNILAI